MCLARILHLQPSRWGREACRRCHGTTTTPPRRRRRRPRTITTPPTARTSSTTASSHSTPPPPPTGSYALQISNSSRATTFRNFVVREREGVPIRPAGVRAPRAPPIIICSRRRGFRVRPSARGQLPAGMARHGTRRPRGAGPVSQSEGGAGTGGVVGARTHAWQCWQRPVWSARRARRGRGGTGGGSGAGTGWTWAGPAASSCSHVPTCRPARRQGKGGRKKKLNQRCWPSGHVLGQRSQLSNVQYCSNCFFAKMYCSS